MVPRAKILQQKVSTHSRPKAAGKGLEPARYDVDVSTHSRPKAAGRISPNLCPAASVSTHSRPKAAGWFRFRR